MDTAIFELGLSTEATSLYLILADLKSVGAELVRSNYEPRWNSSESDLEAGIAELAAHGVISGVEEPLKLTPATSWLKRAAPGGGD